MSPAPNCLDHFLSDVREKRKWLELGVSCSSHTQSNESPDLSPTFPKTPCKEFQALAPALYYLWPHVSLGTP